MYDFCCMDVCFFVALMYFFCIGCMSCCCMDVCFVIAWMYAFVLHGCMYAFVAWMYVCFSCMDVSTFCCKDGWMFLLMAIPHRKCSQTVAVS